MTGESKTKPVDERRGPCFLAFLSRFSWTVDGGSVENPLFLAQGGNLFPFITAGFFFVISDTSEGKMHTAVQSSFSSRPLNKVGPSCHGAERDQCHGEVGRAPEPDGRISYGNTLNGANRLENRGDCVQAETGIEHAIRAFPSRQGQMKPVFFPTEK